MSEPEHIANALRETADEIMAWARSVGNNGPFANEAYQTNVHISEALKILAAKVGAKDQPHDQ